MSDPREALVRAMLGYDASGLQGVASARGWAEYVADMVLRDFLVVPRSEITGTEYGYQHGPEMTVFRWTRYAEELPRRITEIRDTQRRAGIQPRAQALSRPVLAWSPVPAEDARDGC